jgi:hypothetical protein
MKQKITKIRIRRKAQKKSLASPTFHAILRLIRASCQHSFHHVSTAVACALKTWPARAEPWIDNHFRKER